jgi:hypothetical protein
MEKALEENLGRKSNLCSTCCAFPEKIEIDIFRENRTQEKEKEERAEKIIKKEKRETEFCFGSWKTQISN